jgi:protein arginine N-methyltransferase 1
VDIILSEWMGYFLLYESMLDTVLFARDKFLRPTTGIMLPDKAVLYMCGIEDGHYKSDKIDFWDDVYGFDMSVIKDIALSEPLVDSVDGRSVMSDVKPVLSLDILTCTKVSTAAAATAATASSLIPALWTPAHLLAHRRRIITLTLHVHLHPPTTNFTLATTQADLSFKTDFTLRAFRQDYCNAFCGFFECAFTQIHKPVVFSTSPTATYTHWKQTVFYLEEPITMKQDETVTATITCAPNSANARDLDIAIDYRYDAMS